MPHFTATVCGGSSNTDCSDPDYRATHLGECPDDPNCSDPVFAAANPTLCLNTARLILKPSAAVVEVLQDVQYRAFLWSNGVETELTEGVVYSVLDTSIALMGAGSGNATGIAVGITTVRAVWGSLSATARLEVIAEGGCLARANHFLFLNDVSRSMSAVFSNIYGTRLAVAKSLATAFVNDTNMLRDNAAVMSFDTTTAGVQGFTTNKTPLVTAIAGLATTQLHTNLALALTNASAYFTAQSVPASGRVIVLLTDGENNTGDDPVPLADALRAAGTIIIVVGLRTKNQYFSLLERIASGGFFINVLPSNITIADGWLDGMRQYLCSDNCQPDGGVTVGVGALNFTGWIHWDVTANEVDLIGRNTGGTPFYDVWPGNGLYMDDHGSGSGFFGEVRSKTTFAFEAAKEYRLTVQLAGNNREDSARSTRVRLGAFLDETVVLAYTAPFADQTWDFTPGATTGKIILNGVENTGTNAAYGNCVGRVTLTNLTDNVVMFDDNFDGDNPQPIDPACSAGHSGYGYGYCYGQGCVDGVIPAQQSDGTPLPNLEDDGNPPLYSSTQSAEVCCENSPEVCVSRSSSATSNVSQAAADAAAYTLALAAAQAALMCPMEDSTLINFHPYPSVAKTGYAACGLSSTDYWNKPGFEPNLIYDSTHTLTPVRIDLHTGNPPLGDGGYFFAFDDTRPDPVQQVWAKDDDDILYVTVRNLPAGHWRLYLYGHGSSNDQNAEFTLEKGQFDNDGEAIGSVTSEGNDTTTGAGWNNTPPPNFVAGVHYVVLEVDVLAGETLRVTVERAAGSYWVFNGMQLRLAPYVSFAVDDLINVECNDNWQCTDTSGGSDSCLERDDWELAYPAMSGPAAFGLAADDYWNQNGGFFDPELLERDPDTGAKLRNSRGEFTGVALQFYETLNLGMESEYLHPSRLLRRFSNLNDPAHDGTHLKCNVQNLPSGTYEFYVYAHGGANAKNVNVTMRAGDFDADGNLTAGTTCAREKATVNGAGWESATWTENDQYVVFRVAISDGNEVQFELEPDGTADEVYFNGLQIHRIGGSDNTTALTSTYKDDTAPYPSRKIVDCVTGRIDTVTVALNGLTIAAGTVVDIILESPTGTLVGLLLGSDNTPTNRNLVFDDDASDPVSAPGDIPNGSYKPTEISSADADPKAPCPLPPYSLELNDFENEDPNGIWKLWIGNRVESPSVALSLASWELTITTD